MEIINKYQLEPFIMILELKNQKYKKSLEISKVEITEQYQWTLENTLFSIESNSICVTCKEFVLVSFWHISYCLL